MVSDLRLKLTAEVSGVADPPPRLCRFRSRYRSRSHEYNRLYRVANRRPRSFAATLSVVLTVSM